MLLTASRGNHVKCPCKSTPLNEEQLKGVFKLHDSNRDGSLSKEELKEAFSELGAIVPSWRAERALRHADKDGDGRISQDELGQLVTYARNHKYKSSLCCSTRSRFG